MRCRALLAVPCCAIPCRALQLSLSCTPDDNASKHTGLARAGMYVLDHLCNCRLYFALLSFIFHCYLDRNRIFERCVPGMWQQTAVPSYARVSTYVVEPREQQNTAYHSKAQRNKVRAHQSTYKNKYVRTHAASRLFSWSVELLALSRRLFAPKMFYHLLHICLQF